MSEASSLTDYGDGEGSEDSGADSPRSELTPRCGGRVGRTHVAGGCRLAVCVFRCGVVVHDASFTDTGVCTRYPPSHTHRHT
jgi:hypothetical protein